MPHDFKALSSHDFELLVRDLLQAEMKIPLESFRSGRDHGIDLRYSSAGATELIIQCKHWAGSSVAHLLRELRDHERPKVERLAPKRYVLATSLSLSPANKAALLSVLQPFTLDPSDLLGLEDLNNLLARHSEIERQHYKLWLTSEPVLQQVLHSGIYRETEVEVEAVRRRLSRYVTSSAFHVAQTIVDGNGYCIITGPPGIGKTTLAEILLIHYADRGYEPIRLTSTAREAFEVLKPRKRQIFYYDDFLGQTAAESKLDKNEDQTLVRLANLARGSTTTRLVLTTREYILNAARQIYEPLTRWDVESAKCVLELATYTRGERARILFNHIYFSSLPTADRQSLVVDRSYATIVDHPNFNPRLIESIVATTERHSLRHASTPTPSLRSFSSELLRTLDHPADLWTHAFENQISSAARSLLFSLVGLPQEGEMDDVLEGANSFRTVEASQHAVQRRPDELRRALKELDGSFISIKARKYSPRRFIAFASPSVQECVEVQFREAPEVVRALLTASPFFEQLRSLWGHERIHGQVIATPFRSLLKMNGRLYVEGLDRTFESRSTRFYELRHDRYGASRSIERDKRRLVSRLSFLVQLTTDEDMRPLVVGSLTRRLPEVVRADRLDNEDAEMLAQALVDLQGLESPDLDIDALADSLMSRLRADPWPLADSYRGVTVLLEGSPGVFAGEASAIKRDFDEGLPGEIEVLFDNCDTADDLSWVEESLSRLGQIADALSIDAEPALKDAQARLRTLEGELAPQEPDDDEYGWHRQNAVEADSDRDLDNLFDHFRHGGGEGGSSSKE